MLTPAHLAAIAKQHKAQTTPEVLAAIQAGYLHGTNRHVMRVEFDKKESKNESHPN